MADGKEMDGDWKFVREFAKQIMEAQGFDSVAILATKRKPDSGETYRVTANVGNQYASIAAMREFLICDEESARLRERKESGEE